MGGNESQDATAVGDRGKRSSKNCNCFVVSLIDGKSTAGYKYFITGLPSHTL